MAFDVVIRGGRILDGTGGPARPADIAIRKERIVRVGYLGRSAADRVINARTWFFK